MRNQTVLISGASIAGPALAYWLGRYAPALAQADIGIAMGAFGTDVAIEAAHIALLRDDWRLVPEVLSIARRTMGVVKLNIGFTAVYNLAGLLLAALAFLPPILAAAALRRQES